MGRTCTTVSATLRSAASRAAQRSAVCDSADPSTPTMSPRGSDRCDIFALLLTRMGEDTASWERYKLDDGRSGGVGHQPSAEGPCPGIRPLAASARAGDSRRWRGPSKIVSAGPLPVAHCARDNRCRDRLPGGSAAQPALGSGAWWLFRAVWVAVLSIVTTAELALVWWWRRVFSRALPHITVGLSAKFSAPLLLTCVALAVLTMWRFAAEPVGEQVTRAAIRDECPQRAGLRSLPKVSVTCSYIRMGRKASHRAPDCHRRRCRPSHGGVTNELFT